MLKLFCKMIARLSLKSTHRLGAFIGYCAYLIDRKSNHIAINNILQSDLTKNFNQAKQLMKSSRIEAGKALLETFYIWGQTSERLLTMIRHVNGWHLVTEAHQQGKGIIFLTPHLGCFEITSIYYGAQHPITVLYRPPKMKILSELVVSGRQKGKVEMAPANASGVRKLLLALKTGQAIGILPDQIPKKGEGEWADFFGKPAYTMGLASKLANKSNAVVIMAFGERLLNGEGFDIHLTRVEDIHTPTLLNQAIEQRIAQCPQQYLWQYNRYKQRRYAKKKLEPETIAQNTESADRPD
jgi:Kdo2-lipid IVA lauroyltransferase/acyltransferase